MENSEKLKEMLKEETLDSDKIQNQIQRLETEYKKGNLTSEEIRRYLGISRK